MWAATRGSTDATSVLMSRWILVASTGDLIQARRAGSRRLDADASRRRGEHAHRRPAALTSAEMNADAGVGERRFHHPVSVAKEPARNRPVSLGSQNFRARLPPRSGRYDRRDGHCWTADFGMDTRNKTRRSDPVLRGSADGKGPTRCSLAGINGALRSELREVSSGRSSSLSPSVYRSSDMFDDPDDRVVPFLPCQPEASAEISFAIRRDVDRLRKPIRGLPIFLPDDDGSPGADAAVVRYRPAPPRCEEGQRARCGAWKGRG